MRITSIIVLGLAILLGVVAVTGVRGLIANQNNQVQATAPVISSSVVVARQQLEFGTELEPELLREIPWASEELPQGAFTSIDELLNGERRVALRAIAPGELVLRDRVSGYGGRATLSQIIEKGMRAVTIRINDVSGAGGFILPGDRVDVLFTSQPGQNRLDSITNILLEDVRVLAIDQIADETQEGALVAKAATVEVESEDAQRIALASQIGSLSLTLRNLSAAAEEEAEEDTTRTANKTIRYRDLGPQSSPTVAAPRAAAPSPYTSMRVIRGTSATSTSVLKDRGRRTQRESNNIQNTVTTRSTQSLANATAGRLTAPTGDE